MISKSKKLIQKINSPWILTLVTILLSISIVNLSFANVDTETRFGIEFPQLSPIRTPEITEYSLRNELTFLLSENHDFPTISVSVLVNGGSYFEELEMIGLAELLGELLRTGGTKNYTPEEIDMLLDDMAISLSSSGRVHTFAVNMSFLSEDVEVAFNVLNDVLRYPTFNEDSIHRMKLNMNTQIARRNDDISEITGREFVKLVFGKDNPYARTYEYETIANITQQDLLDYHQTFFHPQNTLISVTGDFHTRDMQRLLNRVFGNWKKEKVTFPELKRYPVKYESSVNLIQRDDAQQTWIAIGHVTEMTQRHPDYVPMLVLNTVLGGSFTGRIYQRIRNQLGLAYAPMAYYSVYYDFPGVFYLMSQTVSDKTITAIDALIDEVIKLQNEYITEDELSFAKESFLNSFVFNYDTPEQIVRRQLNYTFWDYPLDFLEQVRDRVNDVTVEDIHRVANEYLFPEHFIILAVGNENEFEQPLSTLGEVNLLDISIRRPRHDITQPTNLKKEIGEALFDQYLEGMGNVDHVHNMKMRGITTEYRGEERSTVEVTAYIEFPDKITQLISTPRGFLSMVYNQGNSMMTFPGRKMHLPPELAEDLRYNLRSNPISLAKNYKEEFVVYLVEEKQMSDKTFYILSFSDEVNQFLLFIDKETMLPYQTVQETMSWQGLITVYKIYEIYDEIDGIKYPVRIVTRDERGNILSEVDFTEILFNVELPEDIFKVEEIME
ncbi:MAG: insulinase family protein [Candidatus Cloacimonetes bacterium]|nr:insulinase family protein [Candidatus Cloacimonadota bacterium]